MNGKLAAALLGGAMLLLAGETSAGTCVETMAQFEAFNRAQEQLLGTVITVTELPPEIAKPYFTELDKMPPATSTALDTAILIEVARFPQVVWVAAVKGGRVCTRWRISAAVHQMILERATWEAPAGEGA